MCKGVISISINDKSYRLQMFNIEIQNEQHYVYIVQLYKMNISTILFSSHISSLFSF